MSQDNAAAPTKVGKPELSVITTAPENTSPRIPAGVLTLVTVALACVVAIAEINRLTGALRDKQDRAVSLMTFVGPSRLWTWEPSGDEAFGRLADGAAIAVVGLRWWLLLYVVLHVVALGCALLLARRALEPSRITGWVLVAAAGLWLVVDVLVVWLALLVTRTEAETYSAPLAESTESSLTPFAAGLAKFAGVMASIGWVLALIIGLLLVRRLTQERADRGRPRLARLRRVGRAVFIQRFSVFVVAVIGGLVVLPGGEIRDQFPDAVRSWTDGELTGVKDAVVAVLALVALSVVVFLTGRLRSTWVWRQRVSQDQRPAPDRAVYLWWLAVAGVALVGGLVVDLLGMGDVDLRVLGLFVAAIVAVPGLSWLVNRFRPQAGPSLPKQDEPLARTVWMVGDIAAGALLAIGGLGLVRAYTAPTVLGFGVWPALALIVGGLVSALVWWVVAQAEEALNRGEGQAKHLVRPDVMTDLGPKLGIGLGVVAALGLIFVLFKPLTAASWLGVIGATTTVLGFLVTLAALAVLTVQRNDPLPVFRLFGLKHTPLLTLLFLVPFLASLGGGDVDVHRVRVVSNADQAELAVSQRPLLAEAFDQWLQQEGGCVGANDVAGHPVRPLVLVAAAGGGIRAAVWTAYGVDRLAQHCGPRPIFLSSGVSGGSLGLALARGEGYTQAAEKLAEPGALTAAVNGLLVRDLLASTTGIRVNDQDGMPNEKWLDRAGLMEHRWESLAPVLGENFLGSTGDSGHLLLNSTSVGTACRMIVSDLKLTTGVEQVGSESAPGAERDPDCHAPDSSLPAGSVDLLHQYTPCLKGALRNGTSAMLSARFPYVTPSGVIDGCNDLTKQQLVDGGYAEGSGLGTLVDLGPELMRLVRAHNLGVLNGTEPGGSLVVPTVVFLQNHFGTDLSAPPSGLTSELLAPPIAARAKEELAGDAALRQRTYAQYADPIPCDPAESCESDIPPLVVVAPATQPSVTAPLGWTLSERSIERLSQAMDFQVGACAGGLCNLFAATRR